MGQLNECLESILEKKTLDTGPDEEGRVRLGERVGRKKVMEVLLSSVSTATTVVHVGKTKPARDLERGAD